MSTDHPFLDDFMPSPLAPGEGFIAHAGEALEPGVSHATADQIVAALKTVFDPEIPVNIYELGLIYGYEQADDGAVDVKMSLTAPGCPVAGILPQQVADAVAHVPGVGPVSVELVWDPPWTMDRMSEEARLVLDMF